VDTGESLWIIASSQDIASTTQWRQNMQIKLDTKPVKITGRTKNDVMSQIVTKFDCVFVTGQQWHGAPTYSAYRQRFAEHGFVLFNMVKFRHKSKDTNTGRKHVRDAHWDAYVYVVPDRLVKYAKQGPRTFKLVIG
jgi:hypothetical protein